MKPFNLQEVIKERVNKEAIHEWATRPESSRIPKIEVVKVKGRVGFINLFREVMP